MEPKSQAATTPNDVLSELVAKIRLHRGVQEFCAEKASTRTRGLQVLNVTGSSLITLVAFSDFGVLKRLFPLLTDFYVMLGVGTMGFILFLANALSHVFSLVEKEAKHRRTVEMYSEILRDLRKSLAEELSEETRSEVLQQFQDRFMDLQFSAISVVGIDFDRAQANYTRRSLVRMARRDHPFAAPWTIRKHAKAAAAKWQEEQSRL